MTTPPKHIHLDEEQWIKRFVKAGGSIQQARRAYSIRAKLDKRPHEGFQLSLLDGNGEACSSTPASLEQQPARSSLPNPLQEASIGFITQGLIYATFPYRKPLDQGQYNRRNGGYEVTIMNNRNIGIPYGKMPRLITAFVCTEAKKTGERRIMLGRSQREFARKLGLSVSWGKTGSMTTLIDQAKRLFTSSIQITATNASSHFAWRNINLSDGGQFLWTPHDSEVKSLWESELLLSQSFFDECIKHAVPLDLRVINRLESSLAIDIYTWMTYRYNVIHQPTEIGWERLKMQFGPGYANTRKGLHHFTEDFKKNLKKIHDLYPDARFTVSEHTFTLLPSRQHVLPAA